VTDGHAKDEIECGPACGWRCPARCEEEVVPLHYDLRDNELDLKGVVYASDAGTQCGRALARRQANDVRTSTRIPLSLGGKSFDFLDSELRNTDAWEWSPRVEVGLTQGNQLVELLSIGRDSVHLERIELEKVCECGGGDRRATP
jgi:hypothetical protein